MDTTLKETRSPLRPEILTFVIMGTFFGLVAVVYMIVADFEVIGSTAFVMLTFMAYMIGGYLWLVSRRIPPRWEDRPDAEIAEATGEIGVFSPTSWWPLIAGLGTALAFLAAAIGWWIMVPAIAVSALGIIGMVMEFSTGQHAH